MMTNTIRKVLSYSIIMNILSISYFKTNFNHDLLSCLHVTKYLVDSYLNRMLGFFS